jgi:23S rRNA (adenine2503-C2)-methyltransferase
MIDTAKRDIRKLKLEELKAFFVEKGDKAFRAQQVYEWLWQKSAKSFDHDDQHLAGNPRHAEG